MMNHNNFIFMTFYDFLLDFVFYSYVYLTLVTRKVATKPSILGVTPRLILFPEDDPKGPPRIG